MVDLETLVQNTRLPHTKFELFMGDFVFETLVQITTLRKLELLMEDFPSWTNVWRLLLYPRGYRLVAQLIHI